LLAWRDDALFHHPGSGRSAAFMARWTLALALLMASGSVTSIYCWLLLLYAW